MSNKCLQSWFFDASMRMDLRLRLDMTLSLSNINVLQYAVRS